MITYVEHRTLTNGWNDDRHETTVDGSLLVGTTLALAYRARQDSAGAKVINLFPAFRDGERCWFRRTIWDPAFGYSAAGEWEETIPFEDGVKAFLERGVFAFTPPETIVNWTTDAITAITSYRLTEAQLARVRVLGGPREIGGVDLGDVHIVEMELDGEQLWGHLGGQVVNRGGLQLSPIAYPSYDQVRRAVIARSYGPEADASKIDRDIAERSETGVR